MNTTQILIVLAIAGMVIGAVFLMTRPSGAGPFIVGQSPPQAGIGGADPTVAGVFAGIGALVGGILPTVADEIRRSNQSAGTET